MTTPALILTVRFRSRLPFDEIMALAEERAAEFAALDGLLQKYYVHDPATDEVGGVYHWANAEALEAYSQSPLRASIAEAYQVEGVPRLEVQRVVKVLRPE